MKIYLFSLFPALVTARSSFQSGPHDGAVYAAGMVLDGQSAYWTGITYDSNIDQGTTDGAWLQEPDCFVASVNDDSSSLQFNVLQTYGVSESIGQTCRGIAVLSDNQLVVVGTSEPGGLYTDGSTQPQVGFGMTVDRSSLERITGASLFTETAVPYPQAIVVDPNNPDVLYVASMTGSDTTLNSAADEQFPNWTYLFKIGQKFEMTIERLQYSEVGMGSSAIDQLLGGGSSATQLVIEPIWSQQFNVEPSEDGSIKTVYVGGMILKQNVGLIVAGSTSAFGVAYGPAEGDDEDGYVSILDPSTGQLASDRVNNERFGTAEFDIVTALCDDPADSSSFYIVGATMGDMNGIRQEDTQPATGSLQGFIQKINVDSLASQWTVQHGAWDSNSDTRTEIKPWGCAVYNDVVYMAGHVANGAGLIDGSQYHTSRGGDDIFVIQYDKADGTVRWMQQIGSQGNDHVAQGGGINVDQDGNVIIFGDTTGSLYRQRDVGEASDLFEVTLAYADGSFPQTIENDVPNEMDTIPVPVEEVATENPDDFVATDNPDDGTATDNPTTGVDTDDDDWTDVEELSDEALLPDSTRFHQSGPNPGAIYSSGLVYDPNKDQAIILGISYTSASGRLTEQPECLIARIEIESMETKTFNILGTDNVLETCRSIGLSQGSDLMSSTVVVVGNSEEGGLFYEGGEDTLQTGFGMSLTGDDLTLQQGTSLFSESIPYPQAVQVDGNDVYVASMTSNDLRQNINSPIGTDFPNWTYLNKYGKGFTMTIEKTTLPNFDKVWSKTYDVDPEPNGSVYSVFVGGLVHKQTSFGNILVVVGSTRAKGPAYGPAEGDDSDGFITLLDPNTGDLLSGRDNNVRIGSDQDDILSDVCDIPSDENAIIVVGATKGDVDGIRDANDWSVIPEDSLMWFVKKIDISTLEEVWSIQGGAVKQGGIATSAYALGCHVYGDTVYVGGTVEDGARLLHSGVQKNSYGGSDVWVAQLNLSDGSSNWLKQIGSPGNDQLARNGGIVTDKDGDVIVYGDTTGAFYRDRSVGNNADIFLAVLTASSGEFAVKGTAAPGSGPATDLPEMVPTEAPVAPEVYQEEVTQAGETIPSNIIAIQLGPDVGPSYAGGMDYDPSANSLYLTGATYGAFSGPGVRATKTSSCFFSRIDLPGLDVIQRDRYGTDMQHDSCTAIAANNFGGQRNIIAIGATEYGGLLTELVSRGSKQFGFAMDLSLQHKYEFLGGAIVGDQPVNYPVALVADEENFWTVSMISNDASISPDYDRVRHDEFPDFTNGGVDKYGNQFKMSVSCFKYTRSGDGDPFAQGAAKSFETEWTQTIALGDEYDGMLVSGMTTVGNYLLVVGTVRREGILDGFIAKVSREDGTMDKSGASGEVEQYVEAHDDSDSWLMDACADPNDPESFYIVGGTQSNWDGTKEPPKNPNKRPVHAFAAKINLQDLSLEWLVRLELDDKKGQTAAAAYGCAVVPNENLLYISGTVENGARMRDAMESRGVPGKSAGGDDIFVAQVSTSNGQLRWLKQTGSNGDDRVARGGGIKIDKNGNAIVYGDTTGDFFRTRAKGIDKKERYNDIFVMLFDKHYGIHQPPLTGPKLKNKQAPSEFYNDYTKNTNTKLQAGGIAVLVIFILGLMYCLYRRYCRRSRKEPVSIYDAAAADLSYHDEDNKSSGFAVGLFKDDPEKEGVTTETNLNYRDDVDEEDQGGLTGNFHKTYSDLPQSGKEII